MGTKLILSSWVQVYINLKPKKSDEADGASSSHSS
jgi:hypothetical protein